MQPFAGWGVQGCAARVGRTGAGRGARGSGAHHARGV